MQKIYLIIIFFINSCIVEEIQLYYSVSNLNKFSCEVNDETNFFDVSVQSASYYQHTLLSQIELIVNNYSNQEITIDSTCVEYKSNLFDYEVYLKKKKVKPHQENIIVLLGLLGNINIDRTTYISKSKEIIILRIYGYTEKTEKILLCCLKLIS